MKIVLHEFISPTVTSFVSESIDSHDSEGRVNGKKLYLKGIMIQGGIRNQNQRIYPVREIDRAVRTLQDQLKNGYSVLGELNHPQDLNINLERVSHSIEEAWMQGNDGHGKLEILPTPLGDIAKTLINCQKKFGVSSRGSGNVTEDGSGEVSDFEIITVDLVSQPSAPGSYPVPIYEHLMNTKGGLRSLMIANEVKGDVNAQRYLKSSLINIIAGLK